MSTALGLTDEQRAARRLGIGGSDIPAIVGLSAKRGPLTIYRSKVDGYEQPRTEEMDFGHRWEPVATRWFEDRTGLMVVNQQRRAIHPDQPWATATLDGEVAAKVVADDIPLSPIIAEVYNLGPTLGVIEHKSFNVVEDGDVKPDVLAQALWQLHVTGLPTAWVTGLVGHAFVIRQVHAADHLDDTAWLVEQAARFWHDHVLPRVPPAPTGADLPMLHGIDATEPDTAVELPAGAADALAELVDLKRSAKDIEARIADAEAAVRAALGPASVGTVAGEPVVSCRTTTRKGLDSKALSAAHPAIAAEFATTTTFRTLRPRGIR